MPLEARLLVDVTLAMAIVYAATPVAIRLATHFEFYDKPVGYKGHAAPWTIPSSTETGYLAFNLKK